MGPAPKDPKLRQRRNRTSTAGSIETDEPIRTEAPPLGVHPEGVDWHPRTIEWWRSIWASPVAKLWTSSVDGELIKLAVLEDAFWKKPSTMIAAEIRLQRQCFGLTPLDQRRLQWEIVRVEDAEAKRKPAVPAPGAAGEPAADPRRALRLG